MDRFMCKINVNLLLQTRQIDFRPLNQFSRRVEVPDISAFNTKFFSKHFIYIKVKYFAEF